MIQSLHRRLTFTVLALLSPVVVGLALAMDGLFAFVLERQADEALGGRARDLSTLLEREPQRWEFEYDDRYVPEYAEDHGAYFQIWRASDRLVIARSRSLGDADLEPSDGLEDVTLPDGRRGRAVTLRFVPRLDEDISEAEGEALQEPVILAVAESREELAEVLARIRLWLWLLSGIALAVAVLAAVLAVRAGLRPLAQVVSEVDRIDERALDRRIPLGSLPRELRRPLVRFNALLDRLEQSFERERRITANVSHELRTPLAAMRAVLELALSRERSPHAYRESMAKAQTLTSQMTHMVENLLMLARIDARQVSVQRESIVLAELVAERWEWIDASNPRRDLAFENAIDDEDVVDADLAALTLIVDNLLSNAAQYTEHGGSVVVRRRPGIVVEVWDSGPMIEPADRDRLFERFWRAEVARSAAGTHAGIGLSLALGAARTMGMRLVVVESEGGLAFRLVEDPSAALAAGAPARAAPSA